MPTNNAANQSITQYNVQTGAALGTLNNVAPSATSGVPLVSQGASSQPIFGTAVVAGGGTGATTLTGVLTGNGTSAITANAVTQYGTVVAGASNAVSSIAPSATSGVPYISQGSSSNPTFGTAVVAGGGTGNTTFTAYSVICAGTTATGAFQNVSGLGTSGQILTSAGAGALPSWQTGSSVGSSLVLLSTQTPSAVALVEFKSLISATYSNYLLVYSNLIPATNGAVGEIQISTDNGSTYIATNYLAGANQANYNTASYGNVSTTTYITMGGTAANSIGASGSIFIISPFW